jgi:predicted N-formylglutamate amidohydrolase
LTRFTLIDLRLDTVPSQPLFVNKTMSVLPDEAFEVIEARTPSSLVLACDHASAFIPAAYDRLGLCDVQLSRHIAYDIGAADVVRALAEQLGCAAVLSNFSRLLIDPNRGEDDPTLIMKISDGAIVAGNARLTAQDRQERLERFYRPYHAALAGKMDAVALGGHVPVLFSIHSFTPCWKGFMRPWHAAVLWDLDPRLAGPLLEALRGFGDLCVGDNEPYDGALMGDTLWQHATRFGRAGALLEIRQDLIDTPEKAQEWAARLAPVVLDILRLPNLGTIERFGSRSR